MKKQLLYVLIAVMLFLIPNNSFAQAPPMGAAADFVLFTTVGAMQNVGTYQYLTLLTGNVGTNSGSNTNFANVNGVMHAGDGESGQCAIDLLAAYNFLAAAIPDSTIVNPVLGNDSTFKAGTYLLPGATSLELSLTLDAQGDPNAVFIFKMPAGPPVFAFSTAANAKVKLINGAQACNVFWFVTGAVNMGTETSMKGTIIAGGAISMAAGDTLEGRALTINGSVTVDNGDIGLLAYLPVDIAASLPTGPAAPVFVESKDFAVFSSIGNVSDDGTSHVTGSVGGNSALPTGFNPLFVSGNIEGLNPATAGAAADLLLVYNSLNTLTADIELLAPAQFGHNLVLTPNTFVMNSAVTFTDTLILDATGNADAVFIIKTYGAFATGVHSLVLLKNGTQAKNVFWMVNGAVSIGDSSIFKGTIIANNGAIDLLKGSTIDGRVLTTDGGISTTGMMTVLPIFQVSINPKDQTACPGDSAGFVVTIAVDGNYTFQWRKGTINLINSGSIKGVTNDTLVIDNVSVSDTGSNYNVIIYNSLVPVDTSMNVSLVVNQKPDAPTASASLQPSCSEATGTITVSSGITDLTFSIDGSTYTNTTGIFTSIAADTYEVTAKNANGCVSTATSVMINAQPETPAAVSASVTLQPTCSVANGTITVSSGITDLSFSIDGSTYTNTTGIFTSVAAGTYEVTAKNSDGCVSPGTSVTLECTTGISSFNNGNATKAVNIYPIPFTTSIDIMINDESQITNCELKIYNALGNEVIITKLTKQVTTIKTSNFPSGIYFYKVMDNGIMIQSGKMISQ